MPKKRSNAWRRIRQSSRAANDIRIGHIDDPELRRNISISYEVVVPAETELRVQSGSGNQTVDGIRGPLEVTAGSGGSRFRRSATGYMRRPGPARSRSTGSRATSRPRLAADRSRQKTLQEASKPTAAVGASGLKQTAPGSVRVDTGSGGMDLRGVHGSLEAKAGSGTIEAEGSPTGAWTRPYRFRSSGAENAVGCGVRSGRPHQFRINIGTNNRIRCKARSGDKESTRPGRRRRCPSRRGNRIGRYRNPVVKQSSVVSLGVSQPPPAQL